jgi:hypothetical protein
MRAIGLGHRTRALAGLHRATTANVSMRGIGMEAAAVLSTIITRITSENATSTIMTDMMTNMVITTMAETTNNQAPVMPNCARSQDEIQEAKIQTITTL